MIKAKLTTIVHRHNAKYPWLIRQRNGEVKLTDEQALAIGAQLVMKHYDTSVIRVSQSIEVKS